MTTTLLRENVLTNDILYVADDGKLFNGGYKAIIEYYTFQTTWNDSKHYKRFKTIDNANKYINKKYKRLTK